MGAKIMKALQVHGFDGTHQWRLEDVPEPIAGPQDIVVQVEATAISYVDLLLARGGYQVKPALPVVPGTEFSGTIVACGPAVRQGLRVGLRVTGTSFGGAWAQRLRVDANAVEPLAEGSDLAAASALSVTYATAHYALKLRGGLQADETVLVLGATGGVGLAAMQVARALGAQVVAGASGVTKVGAALERGADRAVDTSQANWREELKRVAPNGVDVIVDPVGGMLLEPAFRSLKWNGRYLVVGFAEGSIPSLRANLPLLKGAAFIGVDVRQFREREPDVAGANLAEAVRLFSVGLLKPCVARTFPATEWPAAIQAASDRATIGRIVIDWTTLR